MTDRAPSPRPTRRRGRSEQEGPLSARRLRKVIGAIDVVLALAILMAVANRFARGHVVRMRDVVMPSFFLMFGLNYLLRDRFPRIAAIVFCVGYVCLVLGSFTISLAMGLLSTALVAGQVGTVIWLWRRRKRTAQALLDVFG